uniref:Uncharacterized protein n=1 Tax=Octopus bimaculoides TaxID=37653 RepID=A0A0L8FZK9_OCTBM
MQMSCFAPFYTDSVTFYNGVVQFATLKEVLTVPLLCM